jgi:integrative and conjugative element protein (TIGR02256 family)
MYEQAQLAASVRAALAGHAVSIPGCETGGILLGRGTSATTVQITRASPPGPRAIHGPFSFSRDTRFLQRYLDDLHDRTDGMEDYVGEWHVHPALDAPPSRTDRRSLWRIARRKNYATGNPVLVIVEKTPLERRLRVYGFLVKPKKHWYELSVTEE